MDVVGNHGGFDAWMLKINTGTLSNTLEEIRIDTFKVYPNPSFGKLNIKLSNKNIMNQNLLQIFNLQGQLLLSKPITEELTNINLDEYLSKGNYLLQIINENFNIIGTQKIIYK